ncbi:hypothetical protein ASPWEDRAFT_114226 [Aspergillus wentii DTO 134E9]|uniref:Uncharacterized protein n=1 Tax=Aspergillus wentii DTO 134E9 TaxID=1073089 RepID=A0A1L9RFD0_ASPWE|nr:uncharacterized protein ASPWEDRAFT_114226 [Aspergillus wentii DTO 134E9]OJJ33614.1 hypothetical protein ASPWEDRAFT_114226 [Aspergillus wentii DTO 134E9]
MIEQGNYQLEAIDVPPPLPLDLHEHKFHICLQWGIILLTSCIAPLVLYPSLRWGADLSDKIALSVASAVLGASTLYSLGLRTWRLLKPALDCRPLTSESRWMFDFFHWNYLVGFMLVTIVLVIGLTEEPPSVRMESLPPSILLVQVGSTLVIVGFLAKLRIRQPFAVSSHPAGAIFRPGILVIIEDIVAVDGGKGRLYRSALMERYTASPRFRRLIEDLNWFWGFGGLLLGVLLISILSSVHDQTFAWGLGWTIPWIWAGIWTVITTYWVKSALREEKRTWSESAMKNAV